ncbi:transposable element Tcb2 transposase [Trichonephila clavipes]|nr:transposable element Tcb2 transposase [Trichonephila clavipes]
MLGSRTDLHIFDAGSVNGTRYCNEILLPYVRLFRGAMGLQFLFMDDNAPCHRTVAAEQLLESEDIECMDWPARSPDLYPIEHVWDFLGRRLAARTLPPVTIRELRLALQDEWAAMPQQLIDTLILSMGRRCETCLELFGGICVGLMITYGTPVWMTLGIAYPLFLVNSSAALLFTSVSLFCYLISEHTYRAIRTTVLEIFQNATASVLYAVGSAFLLMHTTFFLWPMYIIIPYFQAYPALMTAGVSSTSLLKKPISKIH